MSDELFGWLDMPGEVEAYLEALAADGREPLCEVAAANLDGTGTGKIVLLYQAARDVWGRDLDPGPQKIGDCVSWGWAGSVDLVGCVQAKVGGEEYSWELRTCTEAVYGLSRVEVGGQRGSRSDGSTGAWAAGAVTKYGTISRQVLGEYDPQRAKQWGADGIGGDNETLSREHPIKTATLVTTYNNARDVIANGYPIPVCSGQGFSMTRDAKGFCRPQGSWAHCMKFVGVKDDENPALLCMQSWGATTPDGPLGDIDIPTNSWWVDAETAERMLRGRDSYAISQFDGYPGQEIPWMF